MAEQEPKSELPVEEPAEEVEKGSSHSSSGHDEPQKPEPQQDGGKVQKTKSQASVNDISSIPNGGLRAWLQVLGAFSLFFNTWSGDPRL